MNKKKILIYSFLFLLFCFHAVNNYVVITRDEGPMLGEQLTNYVKSKNLYNLLLHRCSFKNNYAKEEYGLMKGVYPPLLYLNTVLGYLFFPATYKTALLSNLTFFLLLIIYTFKLARVWSDDLTAVFSTLFVSFIPGLVGFSRIYHTDFALTAFITMTTYFLTKSEGFTHTAYSLLAGVGLGLSLISKQSAIIFLSPWYMLTFLKGGLAHSKNFFKASIIAIILSGPWYIVNLNADIAFPSWAITGHFSWFDSVNFFLSYLTDFPQHLLNPFFTILFCISLPSFIWFADNKFKAEIILYLLIPLFIFSGFISIYSTRYLLPLLPIAGIITATGIMSCHWLRKGKLPLFIFLATIIMYQYIMASYPSPLSHYTKQDIVIRDDKEGTRGIRIYKTNLSALSDILDKYHTPDLKVGTLFNTLDAECIRFEFITNHPDIAFNHNLMLQARYGLDLTTELLGYDVVLIKSEKSNFLQQIELYPESFVARIKHTLQNFRNNPAGFFYEGKITLSFADMSETYSVYINKRFA